MNKSSLLIILQVCLLCLVWLTTSQAQERNPSLDDTITLRLGPFLANLDATAKVRGQDISIDENIDTSDLDFSVYGLWRITSKWRIEAGYTGINKSTNDSLESALSLSGVSIPAGLSVETEFKTRVLRLALGYAFMRGDKYEFGADLGVNLTSLKETFQATIPGTGRLDADLLDIDEPLPTIGLFYNYAFTSKWYLASRAGLFALSIGDIEGTIFDVSAAIEYRPWKNVGFGASYIYTSADLEISGQGAATDIEYDYNGPILYVVVGF